MSFGYYGMDLTGWTIGDVFTIGVVMIITITVIRMIINLNISPKVMGSEEK